MGKIKVINSSSFEVEQCAEYVVSQYKNNRESKESFYFSKSVVVEILCMFVGLGHNVDGK